MSNGLLNIENVDKFYGRINQGVHAVRNLSMKVEAGEIVALLGSSGCGKTSTLRMIAGFEEVSRGNITLSGKLVNNLAPVKRNVAMAFEGYSLYPPLTVRDNIAFALKAKKLGAADINSKVVEVAEMLEIGDILDKFPSSISGGQQQRASLGRALIRDANLHLLDEPMGQLEPQLRALLRGRIKHFIKSRGLTAILVTHDQAEANALSDRIAVMEGGNLVQFATPENLKEKPANLFSGTFIGEPPMNVFDASVSGHDNTITFTLDDSVSLSYPTTAFSQDVIDAAMAMREVTIGIRPYALRRSDKGMRVTVVANQWLGDQTHIAASLAGKPIVLVEHDRALDRPDDTIDIDLDAKNLHIFDRKTGNAISHGAALAQ
ncbi:MAG: ABC transporter ATP-binding protein [Granulosicoccus sp.]